MSSLRKFQNDPKYVLNTAFSLFKSKKITTAIVEGVCDKRFLMQWKKKDSALRFDGLDGKQLVEQVFLKSQQGHYSQCDFLYFFADVDYDGIAQAGLHFHPKFVYNAYCFESDNLIYNDLEIFLVNTQALEKLLANYDVDPIDGDSMRLKLERASRDIGAFRAADILIQKEEKITTSILNGLELRDFFEARSISIDVEKLKSSIPNWSQKKHYVDSLIERAEKVDRDSPAPWSLSRGHDVTEMLALHLESAGKKGLRREQIELLLRLACEITDYQNSPMGRKLLSQGGGSFLAFS